VKDGLPFFFTEKRELCILQNQQKDDYSNLLGMFAVIKTAY